MEIVSWTFTNNSTSLAGSFESDDDRPEKTQLNDSSAEMKLLFLLENVNC